MDDVKILKAIGELKGLVEQKFINMETVLSKRIKALEEFVRVSFGEILRRLAEGDKRFTEHEKILEEQWNEIKKNRNDIHELQIDVKEIKKVVRKSIITKIPMYIKILAAIYFVFCIGVMLYVATR